MTKQKIVPPEKALLNLQQGNARFVKSRNTGLLVTHHSVRKLMMKPGGPRAIILSCSDSRAPAEILFDQGIGDLFVIRVAGNIIAPSLIGSIEFAVATMPARLIVVMGHTKCGAVQATYDAIVGRKPLLSENIHDIVDRIKPHIQTLIGRKKAPKNPTALLREAVRANVFGSLAHLRHASRFLEEMVRSQHLLIVGAEYDIETGVVDFFDIPTKK